MDDEALARFAFGPTKDESGREIARREQSPIKTMFFAQIDRRLIERF
jgi:hypothetical protein